LGEIALGVVGISRIPLAGELVVRVEAGGFAAETLRWVSW